MFYMAANSSIPSVSMNTVPTSASSQESLASSVVQIYAGVVTAIVVIFSFIAYFKQIPVFVLLSNFFMVTVEYVAMLFLITAGTHNTALLHVWGTQVLYLQLGVLFSTAGAFFLNLFPGQGDLAIMNDMQIKPGTMKRWLVVGLFQFVYLFSIALNIAAIIFTYTAT
jgi:hypothetical protein